MTAADLLGRPVWYELQTPELAAAETFYGVVVGWGARTFPGLPFRYATWVTDAGATVGGALEFTDEMRREGVRPQWVLYVGTPSLETSAGLATRLGGTVVSPVVDVPTVGLMQMLRDPQHGLFALFQPMTLPSAPAGPANLGEVAWIELTTSDVAGGLAFYQALFGWRPTETLDLGEMGPYQMFGRDDHSLGGVLRQPAGDGPARWDVYFRVADVHVAAAKASARGARIVQGPGEVPGGGWFVQGVDPQGAAFSLFQQA